MYTITDFRPAASFKVSPSEFRIRMSPSALEIVQALTEKVRRIEGVKRMRPCDGVTTGCAELDAILPHGAFRRGTLVEWLGTAAGGATTLAFVVARQALAQGGALVVIDPQRTYYPPAAAALGIELERMIVVQPRCNADHAWALDQALRCAGVSAALAWPPCWDDHIFRRLQLAAESSGALGLLIRSEACCHQPSWADVRLLVEPLNARVPLLAGYPLGAAVPAEVNDLAPVPLAARQSVQTFGSSAYQQNRLQMPSPQPSPRGRGSYARKFRVEVLRVRGGAGRGFSEIELNEQTGALHGTTPTSALRMAAELAAPAARRRSRGA